MNKNEVKAKAKSRGLSVEFQFNLARNTGRYFEVGYVYDNGSRELFCKRQPNSTENDFRLCNEYAEG